MPLHTLRQLLALPALALMTVTCDGGPAAPSDDVIGGQYLLSSVNGRSLPVVYYRSADGTFYVAVDSGSIAFFADSMVRVISHRRVFYPDSPNPAPQTGYDSVQFRGTLPQLRIARSSTEWDTATVNGPEIEVHWTLEGLDLGRWLYRRSR